MNHRRWSAIWLVLSCISGVAACRRQPPVAVTDPPFGWRGDGSGRFSSARPPTRWKLDRGIAWSTALPSWSNASPAFSRGLIFVASEPSTLVAINASDGRVQWSHETVPADALSGAEATAARAEQQRGDDAAKELERLQQEISRLKRESRGDAAPEARQKLSELETRIAGLEKVVADTERFRPPRPGDMIGNASGTPVTDGHAVYEVFGDGLAVAFDRAGNRLWTTALGGESVDMLCSTWGGSEPHRGHTSSPVLVDDRLIVGLGRVQALDVRDGHVLWRSEAYPDFGTPAVARLGESAVILTPHGSVIRVSDGEVFHQGLATLCYSAPLVDQGIAYFAGSRPAADGGSRLEGHVRAVQLPATAANASDWKVLFDTALPDDRYFASPVLDGGLLYTVSVSGRVTVVDVATGTAAWDRSIWEEGLPTDRWLDFYPSIALAGGLLFVTGTSPDTATTWVLSSGRTPRVLARNESEAMRASPVLAESHLYARGLQHVFSVHDQGTEATGVSATLPSRPEDNDRAALHSP